MNNTGKTKPLTSKSVERVTMPFHRLLQTALRGTNRKQWWICPGVAGMPNFPQKCIDDLLNTEPRPTSHQKDKIILTIKYGVVDTVMIVGWCAALALGQLALICKTKNCAHAEDSEGQWQIISLWMKHIWVVQ